MQIPENAKILGDLAKRIKRLGPILLCVKRDEEATTVVLPMLKDLAGSAFVKHQHFPANNLFRELALLNADICIASRRGGLNQLICTDDLSEHISSLDHIITELTVRQFDSNIDYSLF